MSRSYGTYRHLLPVDMHIPPKQIRMRLLEYGVTILEFAQLVGISSDHMSNILNDQRQPSFVVRLRIQEVLKSVEKEYMARKEA